MIWYRCSPYEYRDGRLCPKPGAELDFFDPWAEYELSRSRAGESPPYLSLLNLMAEIRSEVRFRNSGGQRLKGCYIDLPTPPRIQAISDRALNRVIEWTDTYGLLGILFQRMLQFQVATPDPDLPSFRVNGTRAGVGPGYNKVLVRASEKRRPMHLLSQSDGALLGDYADGASPRKLRLRCPSFGFLYGAASRFLAQLSAPSPLCLPKTSWLTRNE